jgi:phosphoenolpyruvate carboxykinase (GTP)
VLRWIIDRCENRVGARETPIGYLPEAKDIDTSGLDVNDKAMQELLSVDVEQWLTEMESVGEYLTGFGERLPEALRQEHERVLSELREPS